MLQFLPSSKSIRIVLLIIFSSGCLIFNGFASQRTAEYILEKKITINLNNGTLKQAFDQISLKAHVSIIYSNFNELNKKVAGFSAVNEPLGNLLKKVLQPFQLAFQVIDGGIVIDRTNPNETKPVSQKINASTSNIDIKGKVTDSVGNPLSGATIKIKGGREIGVSNNNGEFSINDIPVNTVLIFSFVGYNSQEIKLSEKSDNLLVKLSNDNKLNEVRIVSTGYQNLPQERATGSFVLIDNNLINRSTSTDILSRLDGVTSGLTFTAPNLQSIGASSIEIHGRSTLFADPNPLIVVDNFPYDGDINNINPNDVENVTVLKDAAASSIWGARAGNGVIVITTKKGRLNSAPIVSFNANVNIGEKPNLYYTPQLTSAQYIEVEQYLFNQGAYDSKIADGYDALSPAVEIFSAARNGTISKADSLSMINKLKGYDIRQQLLKYFYRPSVNQQYQTSISSGGQNQKYFISAGYDKNLSNSVGNSYQRVTLNASNTYYLLKNKLEIYTNIMYAGSETKTLNSSFIPAQPYAQVADQNGNPIAVENNLRASYIDTAGGGKLLNWQYKPLDELNNRYNTNTTDLTDYKINFNTTYSIWKGLSAAVLYSYEKSISASNLLNEENSYYTHNLINTYTEINPDGTLTYPVPLGGILNTSNTTSSSQNGRFQLNYNQSWGKHSVYAIAGTEIKDVSSFNNITQLYGYDPATASDQNASVNYTAYYPYYYDSNGGVLPTGTGEGGTDYRFFSYFFNGSYSYADKYIASFSARRDESNLFGVNTNQKGVPLWSSGLNWLLNKEDFYSVDWLPNLKLGITYGYTGNVDNNLSAYLTAEENSGLVNIYNTIHSVIVNPPNPSLQWEKIGNLDFSVDFATKNNRITGRIDYWTKKGIDLIGNSPIAPQTGVTLYTGNSANTFTKGVDLQINAIILNGSFKWISTLLYNNSNSKVTDYKVSNGTNLNVVSSNYTNPLQGYPYFSIFSFKYAGLNNTGNPIGYLNGQQSTDYATIVNSTNRSDLLFNGSATPTSFGSLRNTFTYKSFDLSFNIKYELGFYFRRNSLDNTSLYAGSYQMADYENRWQKPGDELHTYVPALIYPTDNNRDLLYTYSSVLVQNGDNIRLQDFRLGYTIAKGPHFPFNNFNVFTYINNIGILWRANKYHIDPDYPVGLPTVRTIAFGIKTDL